MESRSSRRSAVVAKKGISTQNDDDGKLWTEVIRSAYPKFKATSTGPYSIFSKKFRYTHVM